MDKHQGEEIKDRFEMYEARDFKEVLAYINMDDTIKSVQIVPKGLRFAAFIEYEVPAPKRNKKGNI